VFFFTESPVKGGPVINRQANHTSHPHPQEIVPNKSVACTQELVSCRGRHSGGKLSTCLSDPHTLTDRLAWRQSSVHPEKRLFHSWIAVLSERLDQGCGVGGKMSDSDSLIYGNVNEVWLSTIL